MTKIYYIFLFASSLFSAQNIHIEYINKNSKFTNFKENLYINKNNFISIRDSIVYSKTDEINNIDKGNNGDMGFFVKDKLYPISYYKNELNNKIIIHEYIGNKDYFTKDELPVTNWLIDNNNTKQILGYTCFMATTFFRGTKLIAYYTTQIPIKTGPYKFGGLPGLILEIYEENSDINSWIAIKIDTNSSIVNTTKQIPIGTDFISLQEFNRILQKKNDDDFNKMIEKLPKNVIISRNKLERKGVEKKYEWEE